MKSIYKIFGVMPSVAFTVFLFYMACMKSPNTLREAPVSFFAFDTSDISGRLQYIGSQNNGDYFRTITDPPERYYNVLLVELVPTVSHGLWYDAHLGDSIVKHKFSNTLTLFGRHGVGYYKIINPSNL